VLANLLDRGNYLPHLFALRDDRQVFASGIWALAVMSGALLVAVGGDTLRLIPLYAIGVFTRFIDYGVIMPRAHALYAHAASELNEPQLLEMIRDGWPVYAWPYEQRQVWITRRAPLAIRTPNAIGRSKAEPSLRMSAGARLTVILRLGNSKPELRSADFIRSKASRTAPSANPTIRKAGTPALMSTSTSTANASTPDRALESMLPSKFRPSEPPGAPREAKSY